MIDQDKIFQDASYHAVKRYIEKVPPEELEKSAAFLGVEPQHITRFNGEKVAAALRELRLTVEQNFPDLWQPTEACLSAIATLAFESMNGCTSLNLIGNPSGGKTTVLSFFYQHQLTHLSDDFTPRAFVSQHAGTKREDLENVDLLPKIQNKLLLTPELAPLFEADKETLTNNFATLTRVLDGEGLSNDKGTHGHRGYEGDYKFCWLGASTPLRDYVYKVMGKLGNRLFFYTMLEDEKSVSEYVQSFQEVPYQKKVKAVREAMHTFLNVFFEVYPLRSLTWNSEQDTELMRLVVQYAILLGKLRATLQQWKDESGSFVNSFPIIEAPPRAINALLNFARGRALLYGRQALTLSDVELVKYVTFSSMQYDRQQVFKALIKYEGRLSSEAAAEELHCSVDTAARTLNALSVLGVGYFRELPIGYGRPIRYLEVSPEFSPLIALTHPQNSAEKCFPHDSRGVSEPKKGQKRAFLHPQNSAENTFPQKNRGVYAGEHTPEILRSSFEEVQE